MQLIGEGRGRVGEGCKRRGSGLYRTALEVLFPAAPARSCRTTLRTTPPIPPLPGKKERWNQRRLEDLQRMLSADWPNKIQSYTITPRQKEKRGGKKKKKRCRVERGQETWDSDEVAAACKWRSADSRTNEWESRFRPFCKGQLFFLSFFSVVGTIEGGKAGD